MMHANDSTKFLDLKGGWSNMEAVLVATLGAEPQIIPLAAGRLMEHARLAEVIVIHTRVELAPVANALPALRKAFAGLAGWPPLRTVEAPVDNVLTPTEFDVFAPTLYATLKGELAADERGVHRMRIIHRMHIICGADGCRGAWFAVFQDLDTASISWHTYATAHELFCHLPMPQIIALDIPIGLPNEGPRACDIDARRILGPGRGSSVFPAPIRPVLGATSYADACRIRFEVEGKKMSCQAWNIVSKVREVDELLRWDPELQARVREVHPELSFYFLAGQRPPAHKKKDRNGRQERLGLLEPVFGQRPQDALLHRDKRAAQDDVLDAFATLWTAGRIVAGEAQCLPAVPPADSCGVRMAIVA